MRFHDSSSWAHHRSPLVMSVLNWATHSWTQILHVYPDPSRALVLQHVFSAWRISTPAPTSNPNQFPQVSKLGSQLRVGHLCEKKGMSFCPNRTLPAGQGQPPNLLRPSSDLRLSRMGWTPSPWASEGRSSSVSRSLWRKRCSMVWKTFASGRWTPRCPVGRGSGHHGACGRPTAKQVGHDCTKKKEEHHPSQKEAGVPERIAAVVQKRRTEWEVSSQCD